MLARLNCRLTLLLTGALLFIAVIIAFAGSAAALVMLVIATDGLIAVLWIAGACALGDVCLPKLNVPPMLRISSAGGLGLGVFSLMGLLLGLAGWLDRRTALALPVIGALAWLILALRRHRRWLRSSPTLSLTPLKRWLTRSADLDWLWLIPVLWLAMAGVGAAVFPGLLWKPLDPHPYDVVSYHLQVPREWFELGRIVPLHHNVFSFFPFNVEMLFLLAMHATGGPWAGMYVCQFINVGMTVLMLLAVAGAADRPNPVAAAVTTSVPWVLMLACVAYVEAGLLLYTTLALAWAMRALLHRSHHHQQSPAAPLRGLTGSHSQMPEDPPAEPLGSVGKHHDLLRSMLISGIFAGFAAGAKITAVPMLVLPIAASVLIILNPRRGMLISVGAFLIAACAVLSPWLIRNLVWTGNPLFPLAMKMLGHGHFSPDQVERFRIAHSPRPNQFAALARVRVLWNEVLAHWQFGFVLLPAGLLAVLRRNRTSAFLVLNAIVVLVVWIGFTHLMGRFAVSLIPLAALALAKIQWDRARVAGVGLALAAAAAGLIPMAITLHEQVAPVAATGLFGVDRLNFATLDDVHRLDRSDTRPVALIGDASAFLLQLPMSRLRYRTVFDLPANVTNPIDAWAGPGVRGNPDWLLSINPSEIARLHATYKFVPMLTETTLHDRPYVVPATEMP